MPQKEDTMDTGFRNTRSRIQPSLHPTRPNGFNIESTVGLTLVCAHPITMIAVVANALGRKGSWFVLERWITDTPFRQALSPAASDLDVAKGSNAKQILEKHWDSWITQRDWNWMSTVGINAIRLPVRIHP